MTDEQRAMWPDTPLNAPPAMRTGDSIVVIRLPREIAAWLTEQYPGDPVLSAAILDVLRKAMAA